MYRYKYKYKYNSSDLKTQRNSDLKTEQMNKMVKVTNPNGLDVQLIVSFKMGGKIQIPLQDGGTGNITLNNIPGNATDLTIEISILKNSFLFVCGYKPDSSKMAFCYTVSQETGSVRCEEETSC
jgi:hypothetical protein